MNSIFPVLTPNPSRANLPSLSFQGKGQLFHGEGYPYRGGGMGSYGGGWPPLRLEPVTRKYAVPHRDNLTSSSQLSEEAPITHSDQEFPLAPTYANIFYHIDNLLQPEAIAERLTPQHLSDTYTAMVNQYSELRTLPPFYEDTPSPTTQLLRAIPPFSWFNKAPKFPQLNTATAHSEPEWVYALELLNHYQPDTVEQLGTTLQQLNYWKLIEMDDYPRVTRDFKALLPLRVKLTDNGKTWIQRLRYPH